MPSSSPCPTIASGVIKELNLSTTPEELLKHVQADAPLDSTLLTLTVDDGTADGAAKIANAFVEQLLASPFAQQAAPTEIQTLVQEDLLAVREQTKQVQDQIDALVAIPERTDIQEQRLASLQAQMVGLRSTLATLLSLATGSNANQLTVVNPATPPLGASSPKVALNTVLGGVLGLLAAVGIAYTLRRLDDTIKTPDDVESVTGLPLLGMIVRMPGDKDRPAPVPTRDVALPALAGGRGIPPGPDQRRVRHRRDAAAVVADRERRSRRGQDRHCLEPRCRVRPSRSNDVPHGCRPEAAHDPRSFRTDQ